PFDAEYLPAGGGFHEQKGVDAAVVELAIAMVIVLGPHAGNGTADQDSRLPNPFQRRGFVVDVGLEEAVAGDLASLSVQDSGGEKVRRHGSIEFFRAVGGHAVKHKLNGGQDFFF